MIVVTGSSGIIGRAVVKSLRQNGLEVYCVSREVLDLSASATMVPLVPDRPKGIIHLAAAVPHTPSYPDNEDSAALTRKIDNCVFESAREWGCRVVYASTCYLYNRHSGTPGCETDVLPPHPESPYLGAKLDGERLFSNLESVAILRVPAPLGPGIPGTVVAGRFLRLATEGKEITLWGSGAREQNFVDVDDIADGFARAMLSEVQGIFNLSADAPVTMLELAQRVVRVTGSGSVGFADRPDPQEGMFSRYCNQKALECLGWSPKTSLDESIRKMAGIA